MKEDKIKQVNVHLQSSEKEKLMWEAKEKSLTISEFVRHILCLHFAEKERTYETR